MKICLAFVGTLAKSARPLALAAACLLTHGAWAAQFKPTTGGNLDDASNWNNTTDTSYAVVNQQSAALTISSASATLPNNGSLLYRTNVHTNDFGAGNTLTVAGLTVEQGATLVHKSGTIDSTGAATFNNGAAVFTGTGSVLDGTSATLSNGGVLAIEDGAAWNFTKSVTVNNGTKICADGAKITFSPDQNDRVFSVLAGGTLAITNSSFAMTSNKAKLDVASGATAVINGSTLQIDDDGVKIGGDGGTLLFSGGASSISSRFTMTGDEFMFCVSNTTVNFASDSSSKLFITGSETSPTEGTSDRTLKFCGANPHLVVKGTGGLFLRGSKTTLQFDLPRGDFTTDSVIEIPNASASFKGDSRTLAASQIVVNIDAHTTPGTYTLLKGKNAATFLTGANKWVTNSDRAVISANGNNEVVVTVKPVGLVIIVR